MRTTRAHLELILKRSPEHLAKVLAESKTDGDWVEFDPRGLGDMVAAIAKPVAGAIDAVLGTDLQNCGGCHQRQDKLNDILPFS